MSYCLGAIVQCLCAGLPVTLSKISPDRSLSFSLSVLTSHLLASMSVPRISSVTTA